MPFNPSTITTGLSIALGPVISLFFGWNQRREKLTEKKLTAIKAVQEAFAETKAYYKARAKSRKREFSDGVSSPIGGTHRSTPKIFASRVKH